MGLLYTRFEDQPSSRCPHEGCSKPEVRRRRKHGCRGVERLVAGTTSLAVEANVGVNVIRVVVHGSVR